MVWQDYDTECDAYDIVLRIYDSSSETWDTEILVYNSEAGSPCVAAQSNGDIYVVWDDYDDEEEDLRWVYYKVYDYSNSSWSSLQKVTENEYLDSLYIPTIVRDKWDNLHLSALGSDSSLSSSASSEVYYSYWDAPPHIEDLEFHANESDEDSVVIAWTGWDEPDLNTYKIYRKYLGQSWEYVNSTTDTRYSDTESSYTPGGFSQIDYYVVAVDDSDQETYSDTIVVLGLERHKLLADGFAVARYELSGNYPNPFNAQTTIKYNLAAETEVTLDIFDVLGRKFETLVSEIQSPGPHAVTWNASQVASGMYFYRLQAGEYTATKRMSIVK